ncbi:MAG: response regulator [Hydrococcus sp. RU_2_2]|jgi:CheY-like chemotaxis protein|nr:response regulator [Hydrococcus sp. RU_2_2]NJP20849.1 response regulator [Hydrococcus sp. CRU_1_1]
MPKPVIICVDDEEVVLDSLKIQLKKEFSSRYRLEVAENAEEAMEILEELSEDDVDVVAIVSDWLMPGKKGDEFLIAVHQSAPRIVKILLTGHADPNAIERAKKQANLYACLSKPWAKEQLVETIKSALIES